MSKTMWRMSLMLVPSMSAFGCARNGRFNDLFHDGRQRLVMHGGDRRPPVAVGRGDALDLGPVDVELEREMREDMADAAGASPVGREGGAPCAGVAVDTRRPARG